MKRLVAVVSVLALTVLMPSGAHAKTFRPDPLPRLNGEILLVKDSRTGEQLVSDRWRPSWNPSAETSSEWLWPAMGIGLMGAEPVLPSGKRLSSLYTISVNGKKAKSLFVPNRTTNGKYRGASVTWTKQDGSRYLADAVIMNSASPYLPVGSYKVEIENITLGRWTCSEYWRDVCAFIEPTTESVTYLFYFDGDVTSNVRVKVK